MLILCFHHALEWLHFHFFDGDLEIGLSLWSVVEVDGHEAEFVDFGGGENGSDFVVGGSAAHMMIR